MKLWFRRVSHKFTQADTGTYNNKYNFKVVRA